MEYNVLNAFLHLCYLPEASTEILEPIINDHREFRKQKRLYKNEPKEALIKEGCFLLKKIFKELRPSDNSKQIIPLSGGLDSRAILAGLCEEGLRENITAVTYGIPGTYDYEIGKMVAKFADVKHTLINLNNVDISRDCLLYTCKTNGVFTPLTSSYFNRLAAAMFSTDLATYWSSYMGDPLAGSHYRLGYEKLTWSQAHELFWQTNCWRKDIGIDLSICDFEYSLVLPEAPIINDCLFISYPEQLDFCIRQYSWIKKSVVEIAPKVVTPFTHPEWVSFMLAVPNEYRLGCSLYREILANLFPTYYKLPTKNLGGRPLLSNGYKRNKIEIFIQNLLYKSVNKNLNYINYDSAYRKRKDFISLINHCISYLEESKIIPWLNLKDIWAKHYSGELNIWRTLECLVSLAISLEETKNEHH